MALFSKLFKSGKQAKTKQAEVIKHQELTLEEEIQRNNKILNKGFDLEIIRIVRSIEVQLAYGNEEFDKKNFKDAAKYYTRAFLRLDHIIRYRPINEEDKIKLIKKNMALIRCINLIEGHLDYLAKTSNMEKQPKQEVRKKEKDEDEDEIEDEDEDQIDATPKWDFTSVPEELKNGCTDKAKITMMQNFIRKLAMPIDNCRFEDIIGNENAKELLQLNVVLKSQLKREKNRLKGILLHGPPGTGKTVLARAAAASTNGNMNYMEVAVDELKSKYIGEGEKLISSMFAVAEHFGPTMIFIDEIESLMPSRESGHASANSGSISMLLTEMSRRKKVFLVAATNYPWLMDTAFFRRFQKIHIGMPTDEDRLEIIKKKVMDIEENEEAFNIDITNREMIELAKLTKGFSPAEIEDVFEAAIDVVSNIAIKAKAFKKSDYSGKYIPCTVRDVFSFESTYIEVSKYEEILFPEINYFILKNTLSDIQAKTSDEIIEAHIQFSHSAKPIKEDKNKTK